MRDRTAGPTAALAAVVLVAVALLTGCSTRAGLPDPVSAPFITSRPPVPRDCVFETCHRLVGDSVFTIDVPARWNGTLLLWVPGFVRVRPDHTGTAKPPLSTRLSPALRRLFDEGYAVASATYRWAGWSVQQSLTAAEAAYRYVRAHVGVPLRVYASGQSMGGLVSAMLAERHPGWVSGAAPACGVLGGTVRFFDLALDAAFAVHVLLDPRLPISGYPSYQAAARAYAEGRQAVLRAARGDARQQARLLLIADLLHTAPPPGAVSLPFQLHAAAQAVSSALLFSTLARWELARSYRGEFSTNRGVDYGGRIDITERGALEQLAPGVVGQALRRLAAGGRVAANPVARAGVGRQLAPTGLLSRPMVTLHDALDPVAPIEHEAAYAAQVASRGRGDELLQLVAAPPPGWTGADTPPYGFGHCRFTDDELVGVITVLDGWVTTGVRPSPDAIRDAFGTDGGIRLGYPVPPWPGAR